MDLSKATAPFQKSIYQKRRLEWARLAAKDDRDFTALFWSGSELVRNGNALFAYRAHSDFLYLTGFYEPDTLMVIQRLNGKVRTAIGVRPRDLSPNRGSEIWDGERLGVERAPKALGFDEAFDTHQSQNIAQKWLSRAPILYWSIGTHSDWDQKVILMLQALNQSTRGISVITAIKDPRPHLHSMRNIKSQAELETMRKSAQIAALGHIRAMRLVHPGMFEYQLAAEVEREFKREGAQSVAYNSIVAAGANACTLHYIENTAEIKSSDLILIDAGAEYFGYASDITRCFPATGKFSPAQREFYSWVLKAQLTAIKNVKPGVSFYRPHEEAAKVLSTGLVKMGFFRKQLPAAVYKKGLWKKYMPHGTSHWLGMDVHDVGKYRETPLGGNPLKLQVGNVLTIEPGLYVQAKDSSAPREFRGMGVRIEDDVAVTRKGFDVLSASCPKTIDEIEKICGPKL